MKQGHQQLVRTSTKCTQNQTKHRGMLSYGSGLKKTWSFGSVKDFKEAKLNSKVKYKNKQYPRREKKDNNYVDNNKECISGKCPCGWIFVHFCGWFESAYFAGKHNNCPDVTKPLVDIPPGLSKTGLSSHSTNSVSFFTLTTVNVLKQKITQKLWKHDIR